jgi:pyridoxal phosphate enzyme (YggS family)
MADAADDFAIIAGNLADVRCRIKAAAQRADRDPADVTLVAVSKNVPPGRITLAVRAGQKIFGENRVQEAKAKIGGIEGTPVFHFVGHLQANKARDAVRLFECIHSLDRAELAFKLAAEAGRMNRRLPVLIQVDLALEETKFGIPEAGLPDLLRVASSLPNLSVEGLMCIPPFFPDPAETRPFFRRLRELRERINGSGMHGRSIRHLSMGMSHDFEIAVEEGATMVRIGTSIFGERT